MCSTQTLMEPQAETYWSSNKAVKGNYVFTYILYYI